MSVYEDHWYDVTIECDVCHDMFDCEIQLFSANEVALVEELVRALFTRCHRCGAEKEALFSTVSNEYYTAEEMRQLRKKDAQWIFLFRRRPGKRDIF